jgi:hypothetical protein
MDWILHLDTDELIHPAGAREYSLRQLLLDVPGNVDMVVFPNYVSHAVWNVMFVRMPIRGFINVKVSVLLVLLNYFLFKLC